jgi:hypothetical protein
VPHCCSLPKRNREERKGMGMQVLVQGNRVVVGGLQVYFPILHWHMINFCLTNCRFRYISNLVYAWNGLLIRILLSSL